MFPIGKIHYLTEDKSSYVIEIHLEPEMMPTPAEMKKLRDLKPEIRDEIKMYGKPVQVPRFQQTYGKSYKFRGMERKALPMPEIIEKYIDYCRLRSPSLNGTLVNWYPNGDYYIGAHRDNESDLIKGSEIFSFSFGASDRKFILTEIATKKKTEIKMPHGTLLIMGGRCQETHKHEVPKSGKTNFSNEMRINLTFRSFKI